MSTQAYFINQLDVMDKRLYMPLVTTRWGRDIKLRSDFTIGAQSTSFQRQTFGGTGTDSATGQPWISQNTTAIPGVSVDGERIVSPVRPLARQVSYTIIELESSQMAGGQPLDVQKMNALQELYQMGTDRMVYVGDADKNAEGLVNSSVVTSFGVPNGAGGQPEWVNKTPDEILADVNSLLTLVWKNSALEICPSKLLLPPDQYSYIISQKVGTSGDSSIMKFLKENSICLAENGIELDIQASKWLPGAGAGGTDRMVAYTNDEMRVRFPLAPIQRKQETYAGITWSMPYVWAYGVVEIVYPETLGYADGI